MRRFVGRLGQELDAQSGREALLIAALNALSAARASRQPRQAHESHSCRHQSCDGDFYDPPTVADAASALFESVFGKERASVRMVLGVASLPLGMPVELEVILEVVQ